MSEKEGGKEGDRKVGGFANKRSLIDSRVMISGIEQRKCTAGAGRSVQGAAGGRRDAA